MHELLMLYSLNTMNYTLEDIDLATRAHAARVIQSAYRTYQSFQVILNQERISKGSFLAKTQHELHDIIPGYISYFIHIRLNGYLPTSEICLYCPQLSPGYERVANDLAHAIIGSRYPLARTGKLINAHAMAQDKIHIFYNTDLVLEDTPWKNDQEAQVFNASLTDRINLVRLDLLPSIYQSLRVIFPISATQLQTATLPRIHQHTALKKLYRNQSSHLIYKFLVDALSSPFITNKHDVFTQKICEQIITAITWIAFFDNISHHYHRITQLYIYVMSLIRTAVCYDAPYSLNDYQAALNVIQSNRLKMGHLKLSHFPAKSGLDALISSFVAERKQSPAGKVNLVAIADPIHECRYCRPLYFEAYHLFETIVANNPFQQPQHDIACPEIFIAGLTTEHQFENFRQSDNFINTLNAVKIACSKIHSNQYITLIIDQTISFWPENDPVMQFVRLLQDELQLGKLTIYLCKSFQKYASLGTSSIKLGNITILNNGNPRFDQVENYLNSVVIDTFKESKDEIQIATFFLKYLYDNEYYFIEQASINALSLKKDFFPNIDDVHVSGPFIHTHQHQKRFIIPTVVNFGFLFTSTVSWVPRICVGLEASKNQSYTGKLGTTGSEFTTRYRFSHISQLA